MLNNTETNDELISPRIFIEDEDFEPIYQKLRKTNYFSSNIQIFTIATLIGKYIVKEKKPLKKKRGYIRYNEAINTNEMTILNCISISENNNINIIKNPRNMLEICEEYANTGIHELYKWYDDDNVDLIIKLAKILRKTNEKNQHSN